jgi:hypothetical protein
MTRTAFQPAWLVAYVHVSFLEAEIYCTGQTRQDQHRATKPVIKSKTPAAAWPGRSSVHKWGDAG